MHLNDELMKEMLTLYRDRGPCPYVFQHAGKPVLKFEKAWNAACRKTNLRGKLFHDFRRTAVRDLVRSGTPERVAMKITGHKTRSVFDRYNIVSDQDLKEAAKRQFEFINSRKKDVEFKQSRDVSVTILSQSTPQPFATA